MILNNKPKNQKWDLIIEPRRSLFDLRLGELWLYKDLMMTFVRRDFVAVYKQTILGPLWYLIQPVLTTLMYTVIFGQIANLSTDGQPKFLFYMSGTVIWTYFAACLNKTSYTFIQNYSLFGKVYFPRLVAPVSILISNLITFSIQLGLFVLFMLIFMWNDYNVQPNIWLLLLPLLILILAGLGLGFGIIISSFTTKYRDLRFLVTFGVQLMMYATPVIYPVSLIPDHLRPFILANPVTPIVETFRYAFLGAGSLDLEQLLYSFVFMLGIVTFGIVVFNRIEQTFIDTV